MRLSEDLQEDIILQFKAVLNAFSDLKEQTGILAGICDKEKDLKFEANYLDDFCRNELWDQINGLKDEILDKYYPIDYADDEEDYNAAGERYQNSKEARDKVFND